MAATGSGVLRGEEHKNSHAYQYDLKDKLAENTSSVDEFDVFSKTELDLAKAKRVYQALKSRLDKERNTFQDKTSALEDRVFELESRLHQSKIERLAKEEEARVRQSTLEAEGKRERTRNGLLEEELRETKDIWTQRLTEERKTWQKKLSDKVASLQSQIEEAKTLHAEELKETKDIWAQRLSGERKAWQQKVSEKVELLQGQIDDARHHYTSQIQTLQEDLRDALAGRCQTQEELDVTKTLLREEASQRRSLQTEVEELKAKYRRCMELAAELISIKGTGVTSRSGTGNSSSMPLATVPTRTASTSTSTSRFNSSSVRLSTENDVLKKQLKLTQVLLDEELRKNHSLRQSLARLNV